MVVGFGVMIVPMEHVLGLAPGRQRGKIQWVNERIDRVVFTNQCGHNGPSATTLVTMSLSVRIPTRRKSFSTKRAVVPRRSIL